MTCLAEFVVNRLKPLHGIEAPFDVYGDYIWPEGKALSALESDLWSALAWFNPDDYHEWIDNGQRLYRLTWTGMKLWLNWSAKSSKFNYDEAFKKWNTFAGTRTSYTAIFAEAQRRGWSNSPRGYWTGVPVTPAVRAFCAKLAESMR